MDQTRLAEAILDAVPTNSNRLGLVGALEVLLHQSPATRLTLDSDAVGVLVGRVDAAFDRTLRRVHGSRVDALYLAPRILRQELPDVMMYHP